MLMIGGINISVQSSSSLKMFQIECFRFDVFDATSLWPIYFPKCGHSLNPHDEVPYSRVCAPVDTN